MTNPKFLFRFSLSYPIFIFQRPTENSDIMISTPHNGIISRRWHITIKNYWFGQRPNPDSTPGIARLHSISMPISGARNVKSWSLLTDLSEADTEVMSCLSKSTRTQVRRAEREGITLASASMLEISRALTPDGRPCRGCLGDKV